MPKPPSLFSFSTKEISEAFNRITKKKYVPGFVFLQAPHAIHDEKQGLHGKMLVIITRATAKAHDRNLLRRRLRSIYYEEKLWANQVTWIVIAKKQALEYSFDQLKEMVMRVFSS